MPSRRFMLTIWGALWALNASVLAFDTALHLRGKYGWDWFILAWCGAAFLYWLLRKKETIGQ